MRSNEDRPPVDVKHLWAQVTGITEYLRMNVWDKKKVQNVDLVGLRRLVLTPSHPDAVFVPDYFGIGRGAYLESEEAFVRRLKEMERAA